jgi:hypothetical protein
MNKKKQKPISDFLSNDSFAFISIDNEITGTGGFTDSVFGDFANLPLEKQKEIIDKMEEDDENLLNEL